uniref:Argininosuccinate lyase n=1 Tax=Agrobacterium tumefaciens TaxID=358 RepID=Q1L4A5_AGRTU|nr:iminodisuccinate carbon-nitrogen lyase [Agrobacterium tumefaciens]
MRERLSASPNELIVKHLIGPRLFGNLDRDFLEMSKVNRAHVVMLAEANVLAPDVAVGLLEGLARIDERGLSSLELNPDREELYFNLEHALIEDVGADVGGRLHTARSRNDLYATVMRIKVRGYSVQMSHLLLDLVEAVIAKASAEMKTVMTGYTHGQPGQPITAGHYLSGISEALLRDAARILEGYDRINLNPLGACALATTTFPIDRNRTGELLGFDGLIENSLDAVGSRDYVPELIFGFAMAATTVSRFCADLHIWYMAEFNYIGIDDSIAGTSSIMPQKKNPSPIEHLKAKASHLYGALMTSLAAQRGAFFTHGREVGTESTSGFGEAVKQFEAVAELAGAVVNGLVFNRERLIEAVDSNFSTMTELADTYVTEYGISFRDAHKIVGAIAREASLKKLEGTSDISVELVNTIASSVIGNAPQLTSDELRTALDARRGVERRQVQGGPSERSVSKMLADQEKQTAQMRNLLKQREGALSTADARLALAISQLCESVEA